MVARPQGIQVYLYGKAWCSILRGGTDPGPPSVCGVGHSEAHGDGRPRRLVKLPMQLENVCLHVKSKSGHSAFFHVHARRQLAYSPLVTCCSVELGMHTG